MRISLVLIAALILNTTFLFAEPLASLSQEISPWVLAGSEAILLLGYLLNRWIIKVSKDFMLDLGYMDVYVRQDKNKS
ncbi:MAG: hypothetical protein AB3N14_10880 [Flavobacteriaceae bacterium]